MPNGPGPSHSGSAEPPPDDRLDSWKEIAAYLNREVRTVQRWEKKEGLPVHRHQHDKLGSVYAFKSELDAWRNSRRPGFEEEAEAEPELESAAETERIAPEPSQYVGGSAHKPQPSLTPWLLLALVAVVLLAGYIVRRLVLPEVKPRAGRVMLAVLPFDNLSGDPQQDYFSDGFTEEMIAQLGRMRPERLGVIARTTMMRYKGSHKSAEEIAAELRADYILEGSVRRAGENIRITAELIQASDQTHRWAENYDRDLRDILKVQAEVAEAIANRIVERLTPPAGLLGAERSAAVPASAGPPAAAHPVNPDAYEAYLRGRYFWRTQRHPEGLRRSIEYFHRAVELDPNYALAYTGLADAYNLLGAAPNDALPPREALPQMKAAALKALELDDSLSEAHASLADVAGLYDWDWAAAEKEFNRAIALNPSNANAHHWYGQFLAAMGRPQEALAEATLARTLDPYSVVNNISLAEAHYYARNFDQAIQEARKALELDPNFFLGHFWLAAASREKKMYSEAVAEFVQAKELSGNSPAMIMALAHANAVAGNAREAQRGLAELKSLSQSRYVPALYISGVYLGLGDYDQAMAWMEKAYQERADRLVYLSVEPMADPLRQDPRFKDLIRRVGLPQAPPAK